MIDSIGLEIPCGVDTYERVLARVSKVRSISERVDGELQPVWEASEVEWLPSWDRRVPVRLVPEGTYHPDFPCSIHLPSFSLCKLVLGHNVAMLYDLRSGLAWLSHYLVRDFGVKLSDLAPVDEWRVRRLDLCYAYRLGEHESRLMLERYRTISCGRKELLQYPSSLLWKGSAYSVKLYLKGPEWEKHDLPALMGSEANQELVKRWGPIAKEVLRWEVTIRHAGLMAKLGRLNLRKMRGYVDWRLRVCLVRDLLAPGLLLSWLQSYVEGWAGTMAGEVMEYDEVLDKIRRHFAAHADGVNEVIKYCGFYTLLLRNGREWVRANMPKSTFYHYMGKLREAGVSLIGLDELPDDLRGFVFEVPHEKAVNQGDVFRAA